MNGEGYSTVQSALSRFKEVRVGAKPRDGEDVRYFPIYDDPNWKTVDPTEVLRELDKNGLMLHGEDEYDPSKVTPQLKYLGTVGLVHSFEDLSAK